MKHLLLWLSGLLLISNLFAAPSLPASVFFVPNLGQWDGAFLFYYENGTLSGYVTTEGLTLDLHEPLKPRPKPENAPPLNPPRERGGDKTEDEPIIRKGHVLMLDIVGGKQDYIEGTELLSSYSNYFLSRDSCRWRGHVPNYQSLIAREVWPGIDIEYKATLNGIETVFRVQPGADPNAIQLRYRGTDAPLSVDANGCLQLVTSMGTIFEQTPNAFQIIDHRQQSVPVAYHLLDDNTYNLTLGSYDRSRELVIDPLVYSTFFPTNGSDFTFDADANLIIAGATRSAEFPTTPGAYQETSPDGRLVGTISKLDPTGAHFTFSTYVPGATAFHDVVECDALGNIFLMSACIPEYWPLTPNAFDTVSVVLDLGFAQLSPDGSALLYSSFLGGSGREEEVMDISVDTLGRVYLFGTTPSRDFPVTSNAWFPTTQSLSPFLTVFDPTSATILESTYLMGIPSAVSGMRLTVVNPGDIWISDVCYGEGMPVTDDAYQAEIPAAYSEGEACYVAHLNVATHEVLYGSYFWGWPGDGNIYPQIVPMVIQPSGSHGLWLAGECYLGRLPIGESGYDTIPPGPEYDSNVKAFIMELDLQTNQVVRGTYLGGNEFDRIYAMAEEPTGAIIVAGLTKSSDFPVTPDAFDRVQNSDGIHDSTDLFIARFSPGLDSLLYSTYFGGNRLEMALVSSSLMHYAGTNRIWLSGFTQSWDIPLTDDAIWFSPPMPTFLTLFELPEYHPDAVETSPAIPEQLDLSSYPNPFNPSTKISFTIPKSGAVSLRVFDVLGREVAVLLDQRLNVGEHSVMFDADGLASGVYFARLEFSGMQRVRKMVVMR